MLQTIVTATNDSAPSLLGPSLHSGIWFYLIIFLVIFLGAVFLITLVPENSVLFLAGTLAVTGQVSLGWVLVASIAGAYIGYDLNYWTGRFLSLAFCRRVWPRVLRARNIERTRALMERFGPLSVIISRFIPAVNLPPFFAGLESMDYPRYVAVNLAGAVLWCGATVLVGYYVGRLDILQDYVTPLFDLVLLVALAAIVWGAWNLVQGRRGRAPKGSPSEVKTSRKRNQ